jgi:hypothetical protein
MVNEWRCFRIGGRVERCGDAVDYCDALTAITTSCILQTFGDVPFLATAIHNSITF